MVSGVWGPLDIDLIIADKELIASTIGLFVLGEAHHFQYVNAGEVEILAAPKPFVHTD